jgi:hypothetical protein
MTANREILMKVFDRVLKYIGRKKGPKVMPNFVVDEESSDLFGLILGVGELGEEVAQAVGSRPIDGLLKPNQVDDPTHEPVYLFAIGTAQDLLEDSDAAREWRPRAWTHFALVLDRNFDSSDPALQKLTQVYHSVIPLIGAGERDVADTAFAITKATLEAVIKKGLICVDYSDMATVLKYMGGILYSRVVDYLPPQNYGEKMVKELAKGREVELLPIATGVVVTCLADIRFSMGDFDDYGNALRELINEDATTIMAGPHGVHEPTEESPGRSVLLISFVPHDRERYVEDRGY